MPPSENRGVGNQIPAARKAALIMSLAAGATIAEAAATHGMSKSSVSKLIQQDEEFKEILQDATDVAVNTVLAEVQTTVRNQIRSLGPKALEVLENSLASKDGRLALQAAGIILRGAGIMDGKVEVRVGLESAVVGPATFGD